MVVSLGGQSRQTETIDDSLDPDWTEHKQVFTFDVHESSQEVHVAVYDSEADTGNVFSDALLGVAAFSASQLADCAASEGHACYLDTHVRMHVCMHARGFGELCATQLSRECACSCARRGRVSMPELADQNAPKFGASEREAPLHSRFKDDPVLKVSSAGHGRASARGG